jgi:ligand-binding sensor domain-containing protein
MHDGRFVNPVLNDPLNRRVAFDFLEDRGGKLWVASPAGVSELEGSRSRIVIPGGSQLNNDAVVLCETRDGSLWAGTYGEGLWRLDNDGPRVSCGSTPSPMAFRAIRFDRWWKARTARCGSARSAAGWTRCGTANSSTSRLAMAC